MAAGIFSSRRCKSVETDATAFTLGRSAATRDILFSPLGSSREFQLSSFRVSGRERGQGAFSLNPGDWYIE